MRKKLILVLIIFLYSISLAENSEKIVFKDLIFEEIIRDNAFKSEGDLYETDLETIKKLEVINYPEKKVTKIDEIELIKNLEILDIEVEYVKELSFLGSLKKVKTLFLKHPNANIDSIKCLTELEEFSISTNNDFDIKLLENCKKIRKIELYFDKISKKTLKNIEDFNINRENLTDNSKKIIDRLMQKCKMKLKTKYIN